MNKKLSLKKQLEVALKRIAELEAIIVKQSARIAELERRLGLNSENSGKSPSSDGLQKASVIRTKSLREKTGRTVGGQFGHQGSTLKQVENPDFIKQHETVCCLDCNISLVCEPVAKTLKRQIFDIPEIKPIVTEHHIDVKICPSCKKNVEAQIDNAINTPVQYGDKIKSFIVYLSIEQFIPYARIASFVKQVFNIAISSATIESIIKSAATLVSSSVENIENELKKASVKNGDESGIRVNGKTQWLHSLSNNILVHYRVSERRGDVPKYVTGTIVHDHFASYFSKIENANHALCNAHHLRELKAVKEIDKEDWADPMIQLLLLANETKKSLQEIPPNLIEEFKNNYFQIIDHGIEYHEQMNAVKQNLKGRPKRLPGHNLLLRLQKRSEETLRFLSDPETPFTNNEAERAIRMIKVKQKISGCFRTFSGAQSFLKIKSYVETSKKNSILVLQALTAAFQGKAIKFSQSH